MKNNAPQLTICSVYHSDMSKRILEMNEEFVRKMNPESSWLRFAANNSPQESIHPNNPNIKEFPGGKVPSFTPAYGWTGFHDGAASNSLLPHIQTRFVLFLDYDFFIVRPNWIREVVTYMQEKNLGILGVPYHPKYWVKFRDFPSKNCLFVDREKIGNDFYEWNFMPQYTPQDITRMDAVIAHKKIHTMNRTKHPSWPRRMFENIRKRNYIGQSKDVCYDLYQRYYGNHSVNVECFPPTAVLNDFVIHYYVSPRWHPLLYHLEKMIPEHWSFVPKRKGYFTFTRFKDLGYFDVLGTGMEEWWWQEMPLGFHLRGFKERRAKEIGIEFDPEESIRIIRDTMKNFTYPA